MFDLIKFLDNIRPPPRPWYKIRHRSEKGDRITDSEREVLSRGRCPDCGGIPLVIAIGITLESEYINKCDVCGFESSQAGRRRNERLILIGHNKC